MRSLLILLCLVTSFAGLANAQHPVDIQRKTADGDYMGALAYYRKMPSRKATAASAVAAAKSAWALGLLQVAKQEFDRALNMGSVNETLTEAERARIYFSRGIIEFQEDNYQGAIVFATKALDRVPDEGPLRSELLQLLGESLFNLNKLLPAETKLIEALNGVSREGEGALRFLIGSCQMQLGKLKEAKQNLELVPLHHQKGPLAIRSLATIAFELKSYEEAIFWLTKGREQFSEAFLDSWVDYVLIKSHAELGNSKELKVVYEKALKNYPPSDSWLILLQATAEEYLWRIDNETRGSKGTEL